MLALLHTSPVHVPVFDALRDEDHPGLELWHLVAGELLDRAREEGPAAVAGAVRETLRKAVAEGARAVLCTCSTIGGVAEEAGAAAGVPVLRVDRPMAAAAVAAGPRIAVVAALESTLGPTTALIEDEARRAGRPVEVRPVLSEGAWARFEAGDTEGFLRAVAGTVESVAPSGGVPGDTPGADVIVLAQVSMASAVRYLTGDGAGRVPVLSSPRAGLAAAARETSAGARSGPRQAPPGAPSLGATG